ncbi:MAG: hypothetical protein JWO82_1965 [Akkermansiaceae bacterium]|nr:hypothetical protein [Akkermansiaceae bacterium]
MKISVTNVPADQRPIILEVEPEAAEFARSLAAWLESGIRGGDRFLDGQTVQFGWSLLLLRETANGLEALEPDFQSLPTQWLPGVNSTVQHLQLQRAVCDLFNRELAFPEIRQTGLVSPKFYDNRECVMSRDSPENSDSGWVFHEPGYLGPEARYVSLYELSLQKIEVIPFLALPPSSRVSIAPGRCAVTVDGVTKSSSNSEFLRALTTSSFRCKP